MPEETGHNDERTADMASTAAAATGDGEPVVDATVVEEGNAGGDTAGEQHEQPGTELATVAAMGSAIIRAEQPDEVLAKAATIADSLKRLIEQQGLAVNMGGKKHVEINGWQALGTLLGALGGEPLHAETVWARPYCTPDGQPVRHTYTALVKRYYSKSQGGGLKSETTYEVDGFDWEARVEIRTAGGVVVGTAEGMCSRAEESWGKSADYAVRSMAETRAESRAYRRAAGWLVAIAGYNPTPAEEMAGVKRDDEQEAGPPHGPKTNDNLLRQLRNAIGFILKIDAASEDVTVVIRAIAGEAGGYLPHMASAAVCRTARMLRDGTPKAVEEGAPPPTTQAPPAQAAAESRPQPEHEDRPEEADPVQSGDADERPAAGTVEPPVDPTEEELRAAGCTCLAPREIHGDEAQVDDDCPLKGHGTPF